MSLFTELKRRNVFRVALAYLVVGWLALQVSDVLVNTLELPSVWGRGVLALLLVGFIPVMVFAWVYQLTPEGLKRDTGGSEEDAAQLEENEQPAPRVITVMPEEESVLWFGTWVPYYLHNLDEAQEYLSSLDDFLVDEPVLVKTDDVDLNAMEARYFMGKGKREGKPADFFVMLFQISAENIGVAIYIGPPATTNAHKDALLGMMKSISPIEE